MSPGAGRDARDYFNIALGSDTGCSRRTAARWPERAFRLATLVADRTNELRSRLAEYELLISDPNI